MNFCIFTVPELVFQSLRVVLILVKLVAAAQAKSEILGEIHPIYREKYETRFRGMTWV